MHSASKYCKTPLLRAQEVYGPPKSHSTKLEEVAMWLKLPSDVVSEIMKTHPAHAALEAVIPKLADNEKKACRDNIVRALGCMKNMILAIQLAVEYGFGPR